MPAAFKISPKLKYSLWIITIVIWFVQALAARDPLNADAVSYLNIASSCLAGNWHALANGWWSPAYPFLLTFWLKIFNPNPFHHALAVHLFSFLNLIVALVIFEYFLSEFFVFRRQFAAPQTESTAEVISDEAVWLLGYSLFFWITTFLTPPSLEQPDILVFILYLLVASICMQLCYREEWWRYALLGLLLGLGYLAKSVMFPLGFVFLAAVFVQRPQRRVFSGVVLAAVIFVAASLPFSLALSRSKGRFTFGDVGTMAYRHVMGFDEEPLPPTLLPRPAAAPHLQDRSATLHLGTYPPWADPSFEFKGAPFRFSLRRQINRTHVVLRGYFDIYIVQLGPLVCGLLILLLFDDMRLFARRLLQHIVLWLPAVAGLAFYATMRFEGRFLAGYTVALYLACVGSMQIAETLNAAKLARAVVLAVSSLLFLQSAVQAGHEGVKLFAHAQHPDWQVATTLHTLGVESGDRVSYMGYTLTDHAWAYVAGVKIASEIPPEDVLNFWAADEAERAAVSRWLVATGSKALVTHAVPDSALNRGWRKVGDTDYYILPLSEAQQMAH